MIGIMIFMTREMLSLTQLSQGVDEICVDACSVVYNSNERVSRLLFRFILEILPRLVLTLAQRECTVHTIGLCQIAQAQASSTVEDDSNRFGRR